MNKEMWQQLFTFSRLDCLKFVLSALIIVIVTKVQSINDRASALLIALPFTSVLAMMWMHHEKQTPQRIANHAEGTFWFVLPSLPMFLLLPWMLRSGWTFWMALLVNCLFTAVLFWSMVFVLRRFGLDLMPK